MRSMLHNLVLMKDLFKRSSFLNVGAFAMEIMSRSFRMLVVMVMVMMTISV